MNDLYEIELIKQLKARYFRLLDTNQWEAFGACLTEDCEARYSGGRLSLDGRESIVGFMAKHMSSDTLLSMHNGHHPEITLNDDGESAQGIWYLQDTVIDLKGKNMLFGGAIYSDEYVKIDGQWLISKTAYERTFELLEPLNENMRVTSNMFAPKKGDS